MAAVGFWVAGCVSFVAGRLVGDRGEAAAWAVSVRADATCAAEAYNLEIASSTAPPTDLYTMSTDNAKLS
jgi:hypothetical protein